MPKQKLFDEESDEEISLKTENEYAKKYDRWREKEEIHKLEQKYGDKALNSDASSDSEDESDDEPEVSEEMEEQFLKTLALLKKKDPRIYDPNYKFFDEKEKETVKETKKPSLTFVDSDDDSDDGNIFSIEKKAEIGDTDDKQSKSNSSQTKKDGKLKDFLTGKEEHIDAPVEKDLEPLKALWSDPNINEGEAFLRDYILNKRYLEDGDVGEAEGKLRDDDDLEADEQTVEEQGKFERAYNFRFEEPDHEYLKRFPRTMNYIRPKDDRRTRKRAELRTRKEQEKQRKMEEIARLKALKLKEIHEKIAKIKEVTGNEELAFKDEDLEGEFDPEQHDRRMKAIFDEQFYGEPDDEKPVFPELDDELEIENWDNYDPDNPPQTSYLGHDDDGDEGPHCEDDNFNMDADYDPKTARANLLEHMKRSLTNKRRNRKKKSKLARLLETEKPKYLPDTDKTYSEFMEEYYKMDCEDVIGGDLPTRFKYREVVPNDYGLTVEEILLADDKELTQWVPLKKLVKHRPESVQKSEVNTYKQKAADISLKKKILPSLFKDLPEEPELVVPQENKKKKKKKNKKKEREDNLVTENNEPDTVADQPEDNNPQSINNKDQNTETNKKKKKHKSKDKMLGENNSSVPPDMTQNATADVSSKTKKKQKHTNLESTQENQPNDVEDMEQNTISTEVSKVKKKKSKNKEEQSLKESELNFVEDKEQNATSESSNRKDKVVNMINSTATVKTVKQNGVSKNNKNKEFNIEIVQNATPSRKGQNNKRKLNDNSSQVPHKKKFSKDKRKGPNFKDKFNKNEKSNDPYSKLSDERLKAYGLNPKKYRSFLKYKKF